MLDHPEKGGDPMTVQHINADYNRYSRIRAFLLIMRSKRKISSFTLN
jgi:hypothetical protein